MSEIAKVEMSDKNFQPSEIYVSEIILLVILKQILFRRAKVYIFDISDKAAIKEIRNIELDGWTISSEKSAIVYILL